MLCALSVMFLMTVLAKKNAQQNKAAKKLAPPTLQEAAATAKKEGMIGMVMSQMAIPRFSAIEGHHITVSSVAKSRAPRGVATDYRQVLNRVIKVAIPSGKPIYLQDLAPPGTKPGLSAGIPPGRRAVNVDIRRIQGTMGLLKYGSHVEIASARKMRTRGATSSDYASELLAEDAILISDPPAIVDLAKKEEKRETIELTFAVWPDEAQSIASTLGDKKAQLRLFLLPDLGDETKAKEAEAALNRRKTNRLKARSTRTVEIIEGDKVRQEVAPR